MPSRSRELLNTLLGHARHHAGPALSLDRSRSRIGAYVYGNILVLAAVAGVDSAGILDWSAFVAVLATTITTYLAHILAHSIGQQIGRSEKEARLHLRDEFRDSVPIVSSGSVPALIMLAGSLTILPPTAAQIAAAIVVIARLGFMGILVERMTGRASTLGVIWSGILLAVLSAVIVALKVLLTH